MSDSCYRAAIEPGIGETFDEVVVPHLGAARRLARWLMGNEHDAEDVVQEASLRAFQYFRTFTGGNGRAWFLRIVRNTCSGWRSRSVEARSDPFDEEQHSAAPAVTADPEVLLLQADDAALVARALRNLPDRFHQLLVLREIEGLSYRELADVIGIPIGTVMSRLARARDALRAELDDQLHQCSAEPAARDEEEHAVVARTGPWNRPRVMEVIPGANAITAAGKDGGQSEERKSDFSCRGIHGRGRRVGRDPQCAHGRRAPETGGPGRSREGAAASHRLG